MNSEIISLFGKVPSARDFVRVNSGEFQHAGLDLWFQEGMEILHSERTRLPEEPVHFLLPSSQRTGFLGAFIASEDAVGRRFPLIATATCPLASPEDLVTASLEKATFLEALVSSLQSTHREGIATFSQQVDSLRTQFQTSHSFLPVEQLLQRSSLFELLASIGNLENGGGYAIATLISACQQAKNRPAETPAQTIALDCPAPTEGMRVLWLELLRSRAVGLRTLPSMVWTSNRLLVALGPPPPILIAYLANPKHKGSRFWPLLTDNVPAQENAVRELSPSQTAVFKAAESSLAEVLKAWS